MVRFKNRYFTIEIIPSSNTDNRLELKSGAFSDVILRTVQKLHGDFGAAAIKMGYVAKYLNELTRIALLRVRHGPHKIVASTIPFVTKIGREIVSLKILHISATMRHSFKFIKLYQRKYLDKVSSNLKSEDERKELEKALMDFTQTDVQQNLDQIR